MFSLSDNRPILITGASGFVGGYLLDEFLHRGVPAGQIVTLNAAQNKSDPRVRECYNLDIADKDAVVSALKKIRPRIIVHLAAVAEPTKAFHDQERAWLVNVQGTRNLASAMVSVVPDCRFVFAGSSESYGESFNQTTVSITEEAALRPKNYYGVTKAICDVMLGQLKTEGFDTVCVRAFNHTGPRQISAYVVPAFAKQIAKIEAGLQSPIINVGNLDAQRDFLDVRDVAAAYAELALRPCMKGTRGVYNLCSGKGRTISSVLKELLSQSRHKIEIVSDVERIRPSEVPIAIGNNKAIREETEWLPKRSFVNTLSETLLYYRQRYSID